MEQHGAVAILLSALATIRAPPGGAPITTTNRRAQGLTPPQPAGTVAGAPPLVPPQPCPAGASPPTQHRLRQQAGPARQARPGRVVVSDPDCSLPAPRRPSGSGSAGAMSRVSGALREQRGGGRVRLGERCTSWAACLSHGLCAQLTWPSHYLCTMRTGELDRRTILAGWRAGFCTPPKWSGAPCSSPSRRLHGAPGRGRSILFT
eukprot:COSAG06_NODE_2985_length_5985_cov_81.901121_3_plen_205_part_00